MHLITRIPFVIVTSLFISACSQVQVNDDPIGAPANVIEKEEKQLLNETTTENKASNRTEEQEITQSPEENKSEVMPTIVDDNRVIVNVENPMILVNKEHALPSTYKPKTLVIPNIPFYFDEELPKKYLREEAAKAIEALFEKAAENHIPLVAASGYRAYDRQHAIFYAKAKQVGEEKANQVVAFPGQSEHQTGLAMDVTTAKLGFKLEEEFGTTEEGIWLKHNAHLFGFIIRYPEGKEHITGYQYEPWHIRYVGQNVATAIYNKSLTLEEFIQEGNEITAHSNEMK